MPASDPSGSTLGPPQVDSIFFFQKGSGSELFLTPTGFEQNRLFDFVFYFDSSGFRPDLLLAPGHPPDKPDRAL